MTVSPAATSSERDFVIDNVGGSLAFGRGGELPVIDQGFVGLARLDFFALPVGNLFQVFITKFVGVKTEEHEFRHRFARGRLALEGAALDIRIFGPVVGGDVFDGDFAPFSDEIWMY